MADSIEGWMQLRRDVSDSASVATPQSENINVPSRPVEAWASSQWSDQERSAHHTERGAHQSVAEEKGPLSAEQLSALFRHVSSRQGKADAPSRADSLDSATYEQGAGGGLRRADGSMVGKRCVGIADEDLTSASDKFNRMNRLMREAEGILESSNDAYSPTASGRRMIANSSFRGHGEACVADAQSDFKSVSQGSLPQRSFFLLTPEQSEDMSRRQATISGQNLVPIKPPAHRAQEDEELVAELRRLRAEARTREAAVHQAD